MKKENEPSPGTASNSTLIFSGWNDVETFSNLLKVQETSCVYLKKLNFFVKITVLLTTNWISFLLIYLSILFEENNNWFNLFGKKME